MFMHIPVSILCVCVQRAPLANQLEELTTKKSYLLFSQIRVLKNKKKKYELLKNTVQKHSLCSPTFPNRLKKADGASQA